jgi:predicted flap endonuclease-1-like 5' DNA nuclease
MPTLKYDDPFNTLKETQKHFWENVITLAPSLPLTVDAKRWREAYLNQLTTWETTVRQTLQAEMIWVEQWADHTVTEQGMPEVVTLWTRQMEELMRQWVGLQAQVWDGYFELLRRGGPVTLMESVLPPASPPLQTAAPAPAAEPPADLGTPPVSDCAGDPDDLQQISGIGPVMAARLAAAGITRYRQIAALGPEQIEQLETTVLKRPGCIGRDDWILQARALHFEKYGERL